MKGDCLLPVVTLVIYFGSREWDGPLSLHGMFGGQDPEVLSLVPDYRVNLIAPAAMQEGDFKKLRTSLKEVLSFVKYLDDQEKLRELLDREEGFRHLGRTELDVLNACAGINLKATEEGEVVDVCRAIQQMLEDATKEADKRVEESNKRAEESNKRAEECNKRAEESDRRAKESDRRAEEYNKRAEESDKRAEEANKRAKESEEKSIAMLKQTARNLIRNAGMTAEQSMDTMGVPEEDRGAILPYL